MKFLKRAWLQLRTGPSIVPSQAQAIDWTANSGEVLSCSTGHSSRGPGPVEDRPIRISGTHNVQVWPQAGGLRVVSQEHDPQILVQLESLALDDERPGTFWVRVPDGAVSMIDPVLYVDLGKGFGEGDDLQAHLRPVGGDVFAAKVPNCAGLRALRFDPSLAQCDLLLSHMGLTVGDAGAGLLGLRTVTGMTVVAASDLRVEVGSGVATFTSDDPRIEAVLEGSTRAAPLALFEVEFEALEGALGSCEIYLDYGQGFRSVDPIELSSANEGVFSAVLPHPALLQRLRFDPARSRGRVLFRKLSARTVDFVDLTDGLGEQRVSVAGISGARDAARATVLSEVGRALTRIRQDVDDLVRSSESPRILPHLGGETGASAGLARCPAGLSRKPLISVVMPVYNPPIDLLQSAVQSVRVQLYDEWELCIVADTSSSEEVRNLLGRLGEEDARIKVVHRQTNGNSSAACNIALELVAGEWITQLDQCDLLAVNALLCVAEAINLHPETELIYSDEDKVSADGSHIQPFYKPRFSLALLRSQNYLSHLTVHRTSNIRAIAGWRPGFEGSHNYDLVLRVSEQIALATVRHIPQILYHVRPNPGVTAVGTGERDGGFSAGFLALEEHLSRSGADAYASKIPHHPFYRVHHSVPSPEPAVSLLISARTKADALELCVGSILRKTEYENFKVVIVGSESAPSKTAALLAQLSLLRRVEVLRCKQRLASAALNNYAARHVEGHILGLLDDDVEVLNSDWLTELVSWTHQPDIGCVGAKLYRPDGSLQSDGTSVELGGGAEHRYKPLPGSDPGSYHQAVLAQDVSTVRTGCMLVRRSVFEEVGGFDEINFPAVYHDVDFCLRVHEAGYRNIFTPFAELVRHENIRLENTVAEQTGLEGEVAYLKRRWGAKLGKLESI